MMINAVLILSCDNEHAMAELRRAFIELINKEIKTPVIIKRKYENIDDENLMLYSATDSEDCCLTDSETGFGSNRLLQNRKL